MFKQIVAESFHEIADNYKLIRIAFVTTFLHTILTLVTVANYITNIIVYRMDIDTLGAWERVMFLMRDFLTQGYFFEMLVLAFLFFLGYFLIYPMGTGIMINYLQEGKTGQAIMMGFKQFGPLAIIHAGMTVVTLSSQTIGTFFRIFAAEIGGNFLVQAVLIMILFIIIVGTILLPYSMYITMIDPQGSSAADEAQNSFRRSAGLALKNLGATLTFTILSAVLQLRIIINLLILIFVPALFMRIALQLNLVTEDNLNYLMFIIGGVLLLIITYVNAIIEAFFTTYWYKLYMRIRE